MPRDMLNLPVIGRAASVRPESVDLEARTIEIVWTTGATVRRSRWEGWDDIVEYDEELVVSSNSIRLERLQTGGPFLDSHRSYGLANVLGAVVPGSVRIEGGKGYARIALTAATDVAPQVQRILEGTVRNVSVGYVVHEYQITKADGKREHWAAVDWEPMEISAVAMPADAGAQVRAADAAGPAYPCLLVRSQVQTAPEGAHAQESAMPKDNPNPAADDQNAARGDGATETRGSSTGTGNGNAPTGNPPAGTETTPPAPAPETRGAHGDADAAAQRAVAAERERTTGITVLCRRHGLEGEFLDDLVARGVSLQAAREAILDQLAERDPMQGRSLEPARPRDDGSRGTQYRAAVENALLHRVQPGTPLTDAGREFRGLTLMEMARQALERSGVSTRGMGKMELAGAALSQRAVGYHTTGDFPLVLANLGNQTLRAAYAAVPQTFKAWARRATLSDFRPTTRVQISGAPMLEKVPEGAEFTYGTFGEASQQYMLSTYGRIVAFSRQMLINDDLGAFTRVANGFGARASELESDIVYGILLNNPVLSDGVALFHAQHGNLGTAATINEASLMAAELAFAKQVDIDGTAISVRPEYLLVPPGPRALEAKKLLTSTTPGTTADVNVYAGSLTPIVERRLLPTSGQAPWFLAASNALMDTIEYAYLDGEDGVYTETRNGFEVDGLEIKARIDFAAAVVDHRGLYKNPGAAPAA